jgi:amidase
MIVGKNSARDWEAAARKKRESVNNLIPVCWQLSQPLPPPEEQKDVTDDYIRRFLSLREVEITESDAAEIVKQTTTGRWKAREVAAAFCHRAAIAHQMVNTQKLWIQWNFNRKEDQPDLFTNTSLLR